MLWFIIFNDDFVCCVDNRLCIWGVERLFKGNNKEVSKEAVVII